MKKYSLVFLFLVGMIALFSACNDDETPTPPIVSIESLSGVFSMPQGDSIILKANVESTLETALRWTVNGNEVSTDSIYTFNMNDLGNYEVKLTAINTDGETSATEPVEVYGKYKYGTFVLNGGRLRGEINGTLTFINPQGVITDSVYFKENGEVLGVTAQDLYIRNNKLYIVSKNGGKEGKEGDFLVIANAETLKKERGYHKELGDKFNKASHIVAIGDNDIYIRDNNGISHFAPSTDVVTFIKGSKGAKETAMTVADGKVFAAQSNNILVLEAGKDTVSKVIPISGNISGVIPSYDGNVCVSCGAKGEEPAKIIKLNAKDYTMEENRIEDQTLSTILNGGQAAAPFITAKGDTLYSGNLAGKVYRHIFSQKKTDYMGDIKESVEDVMTLYNTVAVHPITGELYANTIKDYGRVPENKICIFNCNDNKLTLRTTYNGYTINPSGIYFTYNFK